jgi:ectoine hydroxylase-related dioxygenase (phytanoyl-CoA dioxygenase family)
MSRSSAHHLAEMAEQGFTIIPDVFSAAEVKRLRAAVEEVFAREEGTLGAHGTDVRFSVNLTNKHVTFRETVQNPLLIEIMAALLGDDFIMGSLHTRSTYPGAPSQRLHRDWMLDRRIPFPTHVNSMWMLDDFTAENGATRVVPGSHLWEEGPETDKVYPGETQATGTAGAVAVFDSRLYHAGGANRSHGPRRGLTGFFCRSWAKPQEDHTRCIDPRLLTEASPLLIRLWGFHAQVPWEEPERLNEMHQLPAPGVPEWRRA